MGSLDSQGIWQYDNTDHVTPLGTFMNLLATSVSNALATAITNLTPVSTAFVNVSRVNTGSLTGNVAYAKYGRVVTVQGALTCTGNVPSLDSTAGISVGTLPAGFIPAGDFRVPQVGAAENTFFLNILATGVISLYGYSGTSASGNVMRIYATYIV